MGRKRFTNCPVCAIEVRTEKLTRHLRKVHPKDAAKHGLKPIKKRKVKTLSAKKQEILAMRKSKDNMKRGIKATIVAVIVISLLVLAYSWNSIFPPKENPVVVMETSMGVIEFILYEDKVPITANNFEKYVRTGFFDGLIFHRIANLDPSKPNTHIIQGGGFEPGLKRKEPTYPPIDLEIDPKLTHIDGAVAMARTDDPNSASSQFYICDGPQHFLDQSEQQAQGKDGYAVFGQVTHGMDVVRSIGRVKVGEIQGQKNVPLDDILIQKVHMK